MFTNQKNEIFSAARGNNVRGNHKGNCMSIQLDCLPVSLSAVMFTYIIFFFRRQITSVHALWQKQ